MDTLVALDASHPYNRVVRSISRRYPGRAATGLIHAPRERYGRRSCRGNFVCPNGVGLVMECKICSLAGVVRDSRRPSVSARDIELGHRRSDTAEIVAIDQVGIRILAEGKHQL